MSQESQEWAKTAVKIVDSFFQYGYCPAMPKDSSLTKALTGAVTGSVSSVWGGIKTLAMVNSKKETTKQDVVPGHYWDYISTKFAHLDSVKHITHNYDSQPI